MPYIKKAERFDMGKIVQKMADFEVCANGDLNYILFKYCKYFIPQNYNSIKNYLGELNECVEEIRRRLLTPYEDNKIKENGDI